MDDEDGLRDLFMDERRAPFERAEVDKIGDLGQPESSS